MKSVCAFGPVGMMPARVPEIVPFRVPEIVPFRVAEIVPFRVPEIVPLFVPDIVPDFARLVEETARTNAAATMMDLVFFIDSLLMFQRLVLRRAQCSLCVSYVGLLKSLFSPLRCSRSVPQFEF